MRRSNFALRLQPSLLEELRKADASSARVGGWVSNLRRRHQVAEKSSMLLH